MIPLDTAKALYREAIDPKASDGEGAEWWAAVAVDVDAVIQSGNAKEAASHIAWWHHDWSQVGDTAIAAAQRLRGAARAYKVKAVFSPSL